MARYSSTVVTDEGTPGIPLAGTIVSIIASSGLLATLTDDTGAPLENPVKIGSLGILEFNVPDPGDNLLMQYRYGGRLVREDNALVGAPAQFIGPTGPSNNTRATLAILQAAATTDLTSLYDSSLWTWTLGDYTGQVDNVTVVASNNMPITTGGWVRSSVTRAGVGFSMPAAARTRDAITPADYTGPAVTLTQQIQAMVNLSIDTQNPFRMGVPPAQFGMWPVDETLHFSKPNPTNPSGEYLRPPSIDIANANIVYVGTAPISTLVDMLSVSNARVQDVRLNGNGLVACGFDARYLPGGAPSLGNSFRRIALENMVPTSAIPGFRADSQNDSDFEDILVAGSSADPNAIGMAINAPGGAISAGRLRVNVGLLLLQGQVITLDRCQAGGVLLVGNDDGLLSLIGGYYYSGPNGVNIQIAAGKQSLGFSATGTHFENSLMGGRILSGDGGSYLNGGAAFTQCVLQAPGGATHGVRLIDDSILCMGGVGKAYLRGGMVEYVGVASTSTMQIVAESVYDRPHGVRLDGIQ